MRRAPLLIAVAASLVLAGGLAWALQDRTELRAELAAVSDRLDEKYDELAELTAARRAALEQADASAQQAKRLRRRAEQLAYRISDQTSALRRLRALDRVIAPGFSSWEAKLVPGGDHDLLVVDWNDEEGARSGVYVWRIEEGAAELIYVVEPRPDFESGDGSYVLVGPPGAQTRDYYDDHPQWVELADWGDATGDGLPDLALEERNSGSGGCGKVRLLQNLGGTLRETYQRRDCNHGLAIKRGRLVLGTAAYPKGCHHIHGCGRKGTWMWWTGSSWEVTKVTVDLY